MNKKSTQIDLFNTLLQEIFRDNICDLCGCQFTCKKLLVKMPGETIGRFVKLCSNCEDLLS